MPKFTPLEKLIMSYAVSKTFDVSAVVADLNKFGHNLAYETTRKACWKLVKDGYLKRSGGPPKKAAYFKLTALGYKATNLPEPEETKPLKQYQWFSISTDCGACGVSSVDGLFGEADNLGDLTWLSVDELKSQIEDATTNDSYIMENGEKFIFQAINGPCLKFTVNKSPRIDWEA